MVLIVEGILNNPQCARTVKANHPFLPGYLGPNYFEVTITEFYDERYLYIVERCRLLLMLMYSQNSIIRIGFSGDHTLENSYLGIGSDDLSCSYSCVSPDIFTTHIDNGFGHTIHPRDVVGCGIDWEKEIRFFTINGVRGKIQPTAGIVA